MVIMDRELLQFLLDKDYAVVVGDKPVLTKKFRDLFPETMQANSVATPVLDKKAIYNKFIEDACVPHRVTAPGSNQQYTVRQFSPLAVNKLIEIIKSGINYTTLVESTKHYYKTVAYKAILSNYLIKEIWKGEYELYEKRGTTTVQITDGSSRWES